MMMLGMKKQEHEEDPAIQRVLEEAFGQVCNFIVLASESGFPITVAIPKGNHSNATVELAKALGAIDTVIYESL